MRQTTDRERVRGMRQRIGRAVLFGLVGVRLGMGGLGGLAGLGGLNGLSANTARAAEMPTSTPAFQITDPAPELAAPNAPSRTFFSTERERAWKVAEHDLHRNTVEVWDSAQYKIQRYLLAGGHQFRDLWVRDFSMASRGALIVGETQAVRDSLATIFGTQRADGAIPRVLDNEDIAARVVLSVIGIKRPFRMPLKPWFDTENGVFVIDGNATIPWSASNYVVRTHDLVFARQWFAHAEHALQFLRAHYWQDGLVGLEPPYADWEDSVRRSGRVAFTNELYLLALRGMAEWAALIGEEVKAAQYGLEAVAFQQRFLDFFWDPERRVLRNFEQDTHLTADANLLAVTYHLVPDGHARDIMNTLRNSALWKPIPGRPTYPAYPSSMKDFIIKLVGMSDYHDRLYWFWISALAARAEKAVGNCDGYNDIMDKLSAKISWDGALFEVYQLGRDHRTLSRVHRILYSAECPFTWSAGMYIEAEDEAKECPEPSTSAH